VLGLLLIGLFAARLMLAESTKDPGIWRVRLLKAHRRTRELPPNPNALPPQPGIPQAEESKTPGRP